MLFPGFQLLDVCGPLDALNLLSRLYRMNLYIIAETLDPVSTRPFTDPEGVGSDFSQQMVPTHTFETVPVTLDVLLVPGGLGTRRVPEINSTVEFVRQTFGSLRYLITVCTGAGIAARAGVLDGRRATTNKLAWHETTALGPRVHWVYRARWVDDGSVWTSSGVSAGIDVTMAWIEAVYGSEAATTVAKRMEYRRVLDADDDPFADPNGPADISK